MNGRDDNRLCGEKIGLTTRVELPSYKTHGSFSEEILLLKPFLERLTIAETVLLDGATGSELNRRGVATLLPLWSAGALLSAPDVIQQIHADYVSAGAELITANTFRTHTRNLAAAGLAHEAGSLTRLAVELARSAAGEKAWVAGSQAPLEDCYSPNLVPDDLTLEREHSQMAHALAGAGVDLILVESQNTIREAVAAARAVTETGLPLLVSFVCHPNGRLLSGESISAAVPALEPYSPVAVLVNCVPAGAMNKPLELLRASAAQIPVGAYGNLGRTDSTVGWTNEDDGSPNLYSRHAKTWLDLGASIIGGCCGTAPQHIRRLRDLIDDG